MQKIQLKGLIAATVIVDSSDNSSTKLERSINIRSEYDRNQNC
jgi:hypothetical protein